MVLRKARVEKEGRKEGDVAVRLSRYGRKRGARGDFIDGEKVLEIPRRVKADLADRGCAL